MRIDKGNIERVIEDYFECRLSEAEEKELKLFLATTDVRSEAVDEAKAVLGVFAMERGVGFKARHLGISDSRVFEFSKKEKIRKIIRYAAAACVVLAVTVAGAFFAGSADGDICIMYANGQRIDDDAIVLAQMDRELGAVGVVDENIDQTLFNELQDMGEAMESLDQ